MLATTGLIVVAVVVLALVAVARTLISVYMKYRGTRVIICPETRSSVAVEVNALDAAVRAVFGQRRVRLRDCSRWPARRGCDQACLIQIEAAPEDCRLRTILDRWYAGKKCALCGRPFTHIDWWDHKPAMLSPSPEQTTVEWGEVPVERLPSALGTLFPVCWNCHMVERFRREYPELVTERTEAPHRSATAPRSSPDVSTFRLGRRE